MGLDKLWETKQRLEQINRKHLDACGDQPQAKGLKYEERHKRITLYLENEVFADLQAIRSQGVSQSMIVNLAVKEFIGKNWPMSD